ncbi:MAG: glycoside hydrolase family 3 C-terminal domain-containing protein, partial [Lachnospiraceae bacterium]|nr:glycoside hydrolase family 3 C-terminal domain-containing protein [Lachnospiraceae bacterium]
ASAYIKAIEGDGVASSLKHYSCNNQETNRMTQNSMVDERAMHEIYLSAFETAVKEAKPSTIMASYNRVDGEYSCANRHMLMDVLRGKWGFSGLVMSDWGATMDMVKCIKSGLDLEMPDSNGVHVRYLIDSVKAGAITEEEVDRAALNVINLGLKSEKDRAKGATVDYDKQHEEAREIEEECAVLLKKGGILPLGKDAIVLVVGELAENMRYQGSGSSHITTIATKNAIDALKENGVSVIYTRGYDKTTEKSNQNLINETIAAVKANPGVPVLFFGGLTEISESEGYDRTHIDIPANQLDLMKEILKETEDVAFIGFGGSAYLMPFADRVSDILLMHLGGQAVGEAAANLICGKANPSGKLSETYPLSFDDVPNKEWACVKTDDVQYRDSIYVGYRYYNTFGKKVAYPFGFGLSYTEFAYSDLKVKDEYNISVKVKNIGALAGKEVVEVFVKNPESDLMRAAKELRGFAKVALEPGEEKEVCVTLSPRSYSVYDNGRHDFVTLAGEYEIEICAGCEDVKLSEKVNVAGESLEINHRELYPDYFKPGFNISEECFEKLYNKPLSHFDIKKKGDYTIYDSFERVCEASGYGRTVKKIVSRLIGKLYKEAEGNNAEAKMIHTALYESPLDSLVGTSGGLLSVGFVKSLVYAANGRGFKAFLSVFTPTRKYKG